MGINIGYLTANRTSAGDEVNTPFYAVEPLTEFLPKDKRIWCPFDEEWSAFYQYLSEHGYDVTRSSLREGKDFFSFEPDKWDILVSNPPFSKKNEVLKRVFSLGKPFALLLPVNSIQGKARYKIFNNEIQMLCFDARVEWQEYFAQREERIMRNNLKGRRILKSIWEKQKGLCACCNERITVETNFRVQKHKDKTLTLVHPECHTPLREK